MKILVIGGTGNVGAEVVRELQKRKADIRLLVRTEGAATPSGVEVVIGDLLDPVSIQKALQRVDKLYLLNAVSPDELTQGLIAYDLAKRMKLKQIVYHSVFRAEHFKDVPHFASKLAMENALRQFVPRFRPRFQLISPAMTSTIFSTWNGGAAKDAPIGNNVSTKHPTDPTTPYVLPPTPAGLSETRPTCAKWPSDSTVTGHPADPRKHRRRGRDGHC